MKNFAVSFSSFWTVAITILCSASSIFAQDNIYLQNGEEIPSKVLEITPSLIKYKKADNPSGPTITIPRQDVWMIKYENGTRELLSKTPTQAQPAEASRTFPTRHQTTTVVIEPEPEAKSYAKWMTAIHLGLSLPMGDYADKNLGAAKTGFAARLEESALLSPNGLYATGLLCYEQNPFKTVYTDDIYEETEQITGKFKSLWSLGGLRFQGSGSAGFYGLAMAGIHIGNFTLDDYQDEPFTTGTSFAYGFGAGIKAGKFNLGMRYFASNPVYYPTYTYLEAFEQPVRTLQISVGVEF